MNAGIVILQDGTPCIAYDDELPYPIKYVEFNYEDHRITLVYNIPDSKEKKGQRFDFPLDSRFLNLLEKKGIVAVASIKKDQLVDIKEYSIIFINK